MHGVPVLVSRGAEDRGAPAGVLGGMSAVAASRSTAAAPDGVGGGAPRRRARAQAGEPGSGRCASLSEGQVSEQRDAPREAMSLAGLRGEVLEKIDKTLRFWDERERQSLAGLRRQVTGIVGHYLGNLRHGGPNVWHSRQSSTQC